MEKKMINENSKLFKKATEKLFELINLKNKNKDFPEITFEEIKYLSGYFIWEFGKNSVVHFKIKEIPDWLFGIWWDKPKGDILKGTLFTQYIDTIDKFKPSYSEINSSICFNKNNYDEGCLENVVNLLKYMREEPMLAFCKDYLGWDYNLEYHTREEAEKKFIEYKEYELESQRHEKYLTDRIMKKIKEICDKSFESNDYLIKDLGENWSPRYEIVINKTKYKKFDEYEIGHYHLSEILSENLYKLYEDELEKCREINKKEIEEKNISWFNPLSDFPRLVDTRRFNKIKGRNYEI